MRRLELILTLVAVFAVAWPAVFGVRPRKGIVSGGLVVALALQLRIEGFRWQMIPLYLVALALAGGDVLFVDRGLEWKSRFTRGTFGLVGVLAAASLALLLPVPELPVPSGPESIGTITVDGVVPDREEAYGERPGGPRRLVAQVWYPARASPGADPIAWHEDWDVVGPAMARRLGFPGWFLNHTRYTDSHAVTSLRPAEGNFPVVIYSHGWTGFRAIAVNQIETLASNGYIVIAPDHTYAAVATRFDDGEVVEYDPEALPSPEDVSEEEYRLASRQLVATLADDIVSVLDELDEGEAGRFGAITGSADLTRVGVFGHSTGGGAAISVCLRDERCDAVLGQDPWVEPLPDEILRLSATRPALYMRSDEWRGTENDAVLRGIAGRTESVAYWVGIDGTGHNDFVLTPLFSPLASQMGLKGPIPAGTVIPIIDNYLLGFFDVFLLDTGPAALDAVAFDEVSVEVLRP